MWLIIGISIAGIASIIGAGVIIYKSIKRNRQHKEVKLNGQNIIIKNSNKNKIAKADLKVDYFNLNENIKIKDYLSEINNYSDENNFLFLFLEKIIYYINESKEGRINKKTENIILEEKDIGLYQLICKKKEKKIVIIFSFDVEPNIIKNFLIPFIKYIKRKTPLFFLEDYESKIKNIQSSDITINVFLFAYKILIIFLLL